MFLCELEASEHTGIWKMIKDTILVDDTNKLIAIGVNELTNYSDRDIMQTATVVFCLLVFGVKPTHVDVSDCGSVLSILGSI